MKIIGLLVLAVVLALGSGPATATPAARQLRQLAETSLEYFFDFDPVHATEMGDYSPQYLRYPDYSRNARRDFASKLRALNRDLSRVSEEELDHDGRIDLLLLRSNINTEILYLEESPTYKDNPKRFSAAAINGIYFIANSPSYPDSAKLELILTRIADLPRFLESAKDALQAPPKVWILLAQEEIEQGLEFFSDIASYYRERFPGYAPRIDTNFAAAAAAMEDFIELLDALKLENERSFAFGKSNFDRLLVEQHFLDFDSDSLLLLGESLLTSAQESYDSLAAIVDTLTHEPPADYFIPKSFGPADVLDYFQWEIDRTLEWIGNYQFVTVPDDIGECTPLETPSFLRSIIGGIAYQPPGPFEEVQTGRFYVQPLEEEFDETSRSAWFRYCLQRGFRGSTVHEAYPGHHLQIQLANRHPSLIRRTHFNNLMIEGWALYCEEAMYEHGFYGDDLRRLLNIQAGVVFRAARIVVDVRLHTGDWSYAEAIGWMMETLSLSIDYVETEVSRYTLSPTQPLSYLVGKLLILELLEKYRAEAGEDFSLRDFHDYLLSQGSVPPPLLLRQSDNQTD
jgi:uncharacterized protein (DUF885 family)